MSQFVPSAHVGHAAFITDHDNLRSAFDGTTVVAARCAGTASAGLREDEIRITRAGEGLHKIGAGRDSLVRLATSRPART